MNDDRSRIDERKNETLDAGEVLEGPHTTNEPQEQEMGIVGGAGSTAIGSAQVEPDQKQEPGNDGENGPRD